MNKQSVPVREANAFLPTGWTSIFQLKVERSLINPNKTERVSGSQTAQFSATQQNQEQKCGSK